MDVHGQKVTIVGLGRTAIALVKLLLRQGATPFVSERSDSPKLAPFRRQLDALGTPYELGGHTPQAFQDASLVIPSPGVPPSIEPIENARKQGAQVMGEIEFASRFCASHILAVTGSNGKTTTTELLTAMMRAASLDVALAGNNACPLSQAVLHDPQPAYLVLEVSSYQLELTQTFHPWIASVLNVTPDHLERHGALQEYARVKAKIFAAQGPKDVAILNADDPWTRQMTPPAQVTPFSVRKQLATGACIKDDTIVWKGAPIASVGDITIPGMHNRANALAAISMYRAAGFDWARGLEGLRAFRGVEHRIEFVAEINSVPYYNDSKATNLDSLKVALESFERPIVLIAGGRGKGADYRPLRPLIAQRVKAIITLGEDAPLLEAAYGDLVPTRRATDMLEAVRLASESATPGDAVLLSPACASFDMFDDFEHRGRVFRACVAGLIKGAKT